MTAHPTKLERIGEEKLAIEWSDGVRSTLLVSELRLWCPCETCRIERGKADSGHGQPAFTPGPATIAAMRPVGNYAYKIVFSDGHDTGLFTFELLRQLGE